MITREKSRRLPGSVPFHADSPIHPPSSVSNPTSHSKMYSPVDTRLAISNEALYEPGAKSMSRSKSKPSMDSSTPSPSVSITSVMSPLLPQGPNKFHDMSQPSAEEWLYNEAYIEISQSMISTVRFHNSVLVLFIADQFLCS